MPDTRPISVVFADDHEVIREGLVALYSSNPELRVVGQCSDGVSALEMIQSLRPDVAIIDLEMPKLHGLELIRQLRHLRHPTKLVVLSMSRDEQTASEALRAGADGYLPKDSPPRHVLAAIHHTIDGGVYISPLLPSDLLSSERNRDATNNPLRLLSERERQVFNYLVRGIRPKQIASFLNISPKTVDTYRASIVRKLGVENVVELVKFAIKWKLI
jgi:DNA-binding NarL/FixJ family response regulator